MIAKTKYIPDGKKELKALPILHYLNADYLYYPVTSARCPEGETCVRGGQFVKVGEVIGTRKGTFFEQPMHSTVSGEVVGYEKHIDQSGKLVDCLIVKNDKKYELHESIVDRTEEEIDALTREDLVNIVKEAGLVGLGGSAFPTYIKLETEDPIDVVIANGVECEPNLIADYGVMMTDPRDVIRGLIYVMKATSAKKGIIAIKKKYTEIKERLEFTLQEFSQYDIKIVSVGNYYPQGWEIAMIKDALGIKIPQGELLSKYGVLNFNVSTLKSIHEAVKKRLPVLERLFTISGDGIVNKNFRARIGTLITDLIELAGGYIDNGKPKVMILGGPMMGTNITQDDVVMTHTTTSLIVLNEDPQTEEPCIRCASCVYSCPVKIQPVQIMNAYKIKDKDALRMLEVNKCIECGLCSHVCPSKIHLTEYMRLGKRLIK
ncbi:RnfABCDGE type electron transport complex subunit C [Peloplasma aerotolerans]|uniref:Ion-translocating oxidoreductase complex subunit C n=1 Tax=Peloplasma aerotolerans TaxID=3044389 RepID=A0AAW6U9P4_9MOLU|nr:RnfABCDGE type electron transport complex subunit C [Mariniplasma sp. M4Ah]MDI6452236.1 RnfABCDGE type electron transport complex subunit C [Mariniplasma sp. M4Ah]